MSGRKTREEKIKSQAKRQAYFEELKRLNNLKKELQEKIENEKKAKAIGFHIRNLKIFRDTCNALMPVVVCAGITIGGIYALKGGLPFKRDMVNKAEYTVVSFDEQDDSPIMETNYRSFGISSRVPLESKITIYSPWEEKDGIYTRYKRVYNIQEKHDEIIETILKRDYKKLFEELLEYKEEVETSNYVIDGEEEYTIEGTIRYLNKEKLLPVLEDTDKNVFITMIELCIIFGIGGTIVKSRDFDYIYAVSDDINEYEVIVNALKGDIEELGNTNNRIQTLRKRGRI